MAQPVVRISRPVRTQYLRRDPYFAFDFSPRFVGQVASRPAGPSSPVTDVTTTDEAYTVGVEVPGLKRDEVSIELAEKTLTVTGGRFEYRRTLPADVDRENVAATLADGVLTLVLPRVAKPAARRVEITEG